jgi:hypothetical protein
MAEENLSETKKPSRELVKAKMLELLKTPNYRLAMWKLLAIYQEYPFISIKKCQHIKEGDKGSFCCNYLYCRKCRDEHMKTHSKLAENVRLCGICASPHTICSFFREQTHDSLRPQQLLVKANYYLGWKYLQGYTYTAYICSNCHPEIRTAEGRRMSKEEKKFLQEISEYMGKVPSKLIGNHTWHD